VFDSTLFWVLLLLVAAAAQLIPTNAVNARATLLAIASVAVLHFSFGVTYSRLVFLGMSLAWLFFTVKVGNKFRTARPIPFVLLACAPLLCVWLFGKQLLGIGGLVGAQAVLLGISYLLVKAYTLTKDLADGKVQHVDVPVGFAYFLFFPTYVAGPMHYYPEFEQAVREPEPLTGEGVVDAVFRFLLGMLKTQVIVPILKPLSLLALTETGSVSPAELAGACIVFSFVLLFDFSGYSDMAIASARLVGIRTPENFRYPYAAQNIRDFWQRWHITFSRVLTTYIFVPLTRAMQVRLGRRRVLVYAAGYAITFLVAGYWHGAAINFLLWGLYHAIGLFAYDQYRSRRGGPRSVARAERRGLIAQGNRVLMVVLTFLFVSLGWILFALPLDRLFTILR
jgi:D-alanyl-lipoteichoic acid acyltransferase DltB (MBOAT superfamily)